jgi:hypothetical protein
MSAKPTRLALTRAEAAAAIGVSVDSFERYVQPELRLVRRGRLRLVPVRELERAGLIAQLRGRWNKGSPRPGVPTQRSAYTWPGLLSSLLPPVYVTGAVPILRSTMRVRATRAPVGTACSYTNSHNDRLYLYAPGINEHVEACNREAALEGEPMRIARRPRRARRADRARRAEGDPGSSCRGGSLAAGSARRTRTRAMGSFRRFLSRETAAQRHTEPRARLTELAELGLEQGGTPTRQIRHEDRNGEAAPLPPAPIEKTAPQLSVTREKRDLPDTNARRAPLDPRSWHAFKQARTHSIAGLYERRF